ncbi:AAA family ATPase [Actinomadura nitritigenes]|uniref:AAA family ATPase n=1 Tax=Actinomadura nitritigenes TaxID=134602 RepID=UPI003D8F3A3C
MPAVPTPGEVAEAIFAPETGLTAHSKVVARPKLLAAVLDELPAGVVDVAAAEDLADAVVALPGGPVLPLLDAAGPAFQTHRERYTTRDIVEAEHLALAAAERGLGQGLAVVDGDTVAMAISAFEATRGFALSGEQRAVVERLTGGGHAVDAVIGVAGAGKTTLMAAARSAWNAAGYTVRGATTAAVAAQALATEGGIGSQTIASLLAGIDDRERPGLDGVDVLVLDEAAMVDDRDLARLLTAATEAGTKVVAIGDPLQLRAIGVGGAFRAIHDHLDGLVLTENRRQREDVERAALATWRDGDRTGALRTWADAGRVHAGDGRDDTLARLLADWATVRADGAFTDPHAELNELLVLAGTNTDVDALNAGARAIRRQLREITGDDRHYHLAGGGTLALAVGDHVRVRRNDYRTRRKHARPDDVDVLNGYRGIVVGFAGCGGRDPVIQWRRDTADGPVTDTAAFTALQVSRGQISHGTAMTVAAAQGQSGERALVYGMGLDPHALYPAMSRDKARVDLYLPCGLLETDADRIRHGTPAGPADDLTRAIIAYAATLHGDRADKLITPELDTTIAATAGSVPAAAAPAAAAPAAGPVGVPRPTPGDDPAIGDNQRQGDPVGRLTPWHKRPYGRPTDAEVDELHASLTKDLALYRRTDQHLAVEMARAERGDGPVAGALTARRDALIRAGRAATERLDLDDWIAGAIDRAVDLGIQQRDAAAEAARNPLVLRLAGTSRAEARARADDLTEQHTELQRQIGAARDRRAALHDLAVVPYRPGAPQAPRLHTLARPPYGGSWEHDGGARAELADLIDRWDTHHAAAIAADRASAHHRAHTAACHDLYGTDLPAVFRPPATNATDRTAQKLAAVTAELDTRRWLPTGDAHTEQQQRAAYRTRRAAEQAAEQRARTDRAAEEAQHIHRHDHGPHHGPSHGISR